MSVFMRDFTLERYNAAATNDGNLLITGGEDGTVAVHTFIGKRGIRSLSLLGRLACHKMPVMSITGVIHMES